MVTNDKAQSFQQMLDSSPDYGLWSMLDHPVHTCHYKSIANHMLRRQFKVMDDEMENEFPFLQHWASKLRCSRRSSHCQLLRNLSPRCHVKGWCRKTASTGMASGAASWPPDSFFLFVILIILCDASALLQYKYGDDSWLPLYIVH